MSTQEEIKAAIIQAAEEISSRFLAGKSGNVLGNIDIDTEGKITITPPGQTPDDTSTAADEEARAGGASGIRLGINLIWKNLDNWYQGGVLLAEAQSRLKKFFILNASEADALVAQYYADRAAPLPYVASFASTLDGYLYCKGTTVQIVYRWIYEVQAANLQQLSGLLAAALSQKQIDSWFNQGQLTPSTNYADYACTKTPSEIVQVPINTNVEYDGVQIWKPNHRIRVTVEGFAVDAQGDRIDFWWNKTAAGVLSFKSNDTQLRIGTTIQSDATQNEVVWNPQGRYSWTFVSAGSGTIDFRVNRGSGIDSALNYTFDVLVEDLGEIIT